MLSGSMGFISLYIMGGVGKVNGSSEAFNRASEIIRLIIQ